MATTTSRREAILEAINKEGQPDFRGIMRGIKAESAETGGAKSKQESIEEYKNDCSEELPARLEGVMRRNAMGPMKVRPRLTSISNAWGRKTGSSF